MRVALFLCSMAIGSAACAQVDPKNPATDIYNKCKAEAVAAKEVRASDGVSYYSCYGETAKSWYSIATDERVVRDKNGIFIARYFGERGYCAHQIEDGAAKPASAYICEIVESSPER